MISILKYLNLAFRNSFMNTMSKTLLRKMIVLRLHWILVVWHCVKSARIRNYSSPHFSHIFPHLDRIRRDTEYLSLFRPNAGKCGKNTDQNNSEYRLFLCGVDLFIINSPLSFQNTIEIFNRLSEFQMITSDKVCSPRSCTVTTECTSDILNSNFPFCE